MKRRGAAAAVLVGVFAGLFAVVNTVFWATPFYVLVIAKVVAPVPGFQRLCDRALTRLAEMWIEANSAAMRIAHPTDWSVSGLEVLDRNRSYLINANHQSWTDIVVLQRIFNRRAPFLRFFLKQELIWVPVLGLAWWALYFPFMKRYSREQIERNPALRGADLAATRKACERLRATPVSILNFLEGTRFTVAKHRAQSSPYRHLLLPKAGGLAFVLGAMGDQISSMLDVTIVYPAGRPTFWEFLCGRVPAIVVEVRERAIPRELVNGDYLDDADFRRKFQQWIRELWEEKDARMEELLRDPS